MKYFLNNKDYLRKDFRNLFKAILDDSTFLVTHIKYGTLTCKVDTISLEFQRLKLKVIEPVVKYTHEYGTGEYQPFTGHEIMGTEERDLKELDAYFSDVKYFKFN
jgi:hypothetical protein